MNSNGINHENSRRLEEKMEHVQTVYFNFKTVLNEPRLLELSNALFTATCSWLVHLALTSNDDDHRSEGEEQMKVIKKLPLKIEPNRQLSYLPEFIMENIIDYLKFLGRFNLQFFEVRLLEIFSDC